MTAFNKVRSAEKKDDHLCNQEKLNAESTIEQDNHKIENLYDQGLDSVNDLLEEAREKWQDPQEFLCNYSADTVQAMNDKPLNTLLAAGGCCIIAAFLVKDEQLPQ